MPSSNNMTNKLLKGQDTQIKISIKQTRTYNNEYIIYFSCYLAKANIDSVNIHVLDL